MFLSLLFMGKIFTKFFRQIKYKIKSRKWKDANKRKDLIMLMKYWIFYLTRTMKIREIYQIIPPLDETLEEPTPLPQDRQKRKQTKGLINSLETAIDENSYKNYVPSIPKNSIEIEIDKQHRTSGLLAEDVQKRLPK